MKVEENIAFLLEKTFVIYNYEEMFALLTVLPVTSCDKFLPSH
jgi:hypothetical protein